MKNYIAIAALAAALTTPPAGAEVGNAEFCGSLGKMARSIMIARQNGKDVNDILQKALATLGPDQRELRVKGIAKNLGEIYVSIVMAAYETPRYGTRAFRERAVDDFGNDWSVACLKLVR